MGMGVAGQILARSIRRRGERKKRLRGKKAILARRRIDRPIADERIM
jgi:hypothetical protein